MQDYSNQKKIFVLTEVLLVFMGRNFRGFREKQGFVISWGMILLHNMLL